MAVGSEDNVLQVNVEILRAIVAHERGVVGLRERERDGPAIGRRPCRAAVARFEVVDVGAVVQPVAGAPVIGMEIERRRHAVGVALAERNLVIAHLDVRDELRLAPGPAVRRTLPVKRALTVVVERVEKKKPLRLRQIPRLRVGEICFLQQLPLGDVVGFFRTPDVGRPRGAVRRGKNIEVAGRVDRERGVVVGVLGALLDASHRPRHGAGRVIVVGDIVLQLVLVHRDVARRAAEHEKRLSLRRDMDGDRHVLLRVGGEAAAVFVAVVILHGLVHIPNTAVAVA